VEKENDDRPLKKGTSAACSTSLESEREDELIGKLKRIVIFISTIHIFKISNGSLSQ